MEQCKSGDTCIMSLYYLPPIAVYQIMLRYKNVIFDMYENYCKQYYFNRCFIYGANGALRLTIPVQGIHKNESLKDIRIANTQNWRIIHWRSIESAYNRSPYFEFYKDAFYPIYMEDKPENLMDWNLKVFELINKLLDIEIAISFTETHTEVNKNNADYRNISSNKSTITTGMKEIKYTQVFGERYGFIKNLSIVDLLFCEGKHAREMLL